MEDEAVLDRGASFLKHVCDEEEVEGKRPWTAGEKGLPSPFVFVCKIGTVGYRDKGRFCFAKELILKLTETRVSLIGAKLTF